MKKHTITVAAPRSGQRDMLACGVYDALKAAPRLLLRTATRRGGQAEKRGHRL